jgi:hypothetical protein
MMDVEIIGKSLKQLSEIGEWLDTKMPNPPLSEPQRWTLGYDADGHRLGVQFLSECDAMYFIMRWGG